MFMCLSMGVYIMYIALGHNKVSRLQEMSRFQGVHLKGFVCAASCYSLPFMR